MRKLLVAIDGSENSSRALNYALALAKQCGSVELHLITVHPEPVVYGEVQVYVTKEKMEALQIAHCQDLLDPAVATAKAAGVPFSSEIVTGDTAPSIVKRADELKCDGIVMGTRGMGAIGSLVLGSVALKVVHLAHMPVTLVK